VIKLAFGIVFLGVISPALTFIYFYGTSVEPRTIELVGKLGPISDWIGGLAIPCFTVASFIILFQAYKTQTEELKLTREELGSTKEQFIEQNKTMAMQRFENSFFQLLTFHHEIVKGIKWRGETAGRAYFGVAYTIFKEKYDLLLSLEKSRSGFSLNVDMKVIAKAYSNFFQDHQRYVGHYFRNLYHILKFIDKTSPSVLSKDDKDNYASLLRSQLSADELVMLFYNAMAGKGYYKFRPLINQYNFLKNMDKNLVGDHWGYWNESAEWDVVHTSDDKWEVINKKQQ